LRQRIKKGLKKLKEKPVELEDFPEVDADLFLNINEKHQ